MKKCEVKGCENKIYLTKYCHKHYTQMYRYGKILKQTVYEPNKIVDCKNYYEIILYAGQGEQKEIARTKIDKDDLEKVKKYKWCLTNHYVGTDINKKRILLHRLIVNTPKNLCTDHINHDKLDNRKQNLRHCTHQQNMMNSKSKGYSFDKTDKIWKPTIAHKGKNIYLGRFKNKQDAITARKNAEIKYFGEFANKRKN